MFLGQAGTFLSFQARRSSAKRSSTSDLTVLVQPVQVAFLVVSVVTVHHLFYLLLQSFLRNERENALLTVIEETRRRVSFLTCLKLPAFSLTQWWIAPSYVHVFSLTQWWIAPPHLMYMYFLLHDSR